MEKRKITVSAMAETQTAGETMRVELVPSKSSWIESGTLTVPRMSEAADVRITGKAEFMHREYDPMTNEWTETITEYPLNEVQLPVQINESDEYILRDAQVKLEHFAGDNIAVTIASSEETNKGHIWQVYPKVTITKIEGTFVVTGISIRRKDGTENNVYESDTLTDDILADYELLRTTDDGIGIAAADSEYTLSIVDSSGNSADLSEIWPPSVLTIRASMGSLSAESAIYILSKRDIQYIETDPSGMRKLDIHFPKDIFNGETIASRKAIVTLHGGSWSHNSGAKSYYNYMTEYINSLGLIHVNLEYRPVDKIDSTGEKYTAMLDDIQNALKFLNDKFPCLDKHGIGLMGYSAGAHLAMLYAYSRDKGTNEDNTIPVKLVISEAGPTDFSALCSESPDSNLAKPVRNLCNNYSNCSRSTFSATNCIIAPLKYASPDQKIFTLLVYGTKNGSNLQSDSDGTVPISNADNLHAKLSDSRCKLIKLSIGHNEFTGAISEYEAKFNSAVSNYLIGSNSQ